ncbi:MAG: GTPase HflX [Deltaproteobacteria bacterium]|nr:MAG: GTPase HflX [Deltaproteobacteria bacterium]
MRKLYGNITGLGAGYIKRLQRICRRRLPPEVIVTPDLSRTLARLSFDINRQVGLLINRSGEIETVVVGDHRSILIPELPSTRGQRGRLRGLRCVHTHLKAEPLSEDDLMDLVFLRLDLMAVLEVDENGGARRLLGAHLLPENLNGKGWLLLDPLPAHEQRLDFLQLVQSLESEFVRKQSLVEVGSNQDRAILVSVTSGARAEAEASMTELAELARSSDIAVADRIIQRQQKVNPKFLMGRGKLSELVLRALQLGVDLLVFDQDLNPSQVRSITDFTELRIIDRTQLILDIFAQRAKSREGKIQVEMAQLKYMLPRLVVKDDALSRLTGGIGGRGPGETKLEINRRRVRDRITRLENQLVQIRKQRGQQRGLRLRTGLPIISIVGYTNAGKSTLLNGLTNSRVVVEDQLFATLDPASRRLRFPRDQEAIITDTVGFIRDLPTDLMEAFGATLEELQHADLLLHVIDVSNRMFEEQMHAVETLLQKLDLHLLAMLRVFNKVDLLDDGEYVQNICRLHQAIPVSALNLETLRPLVEAMETRLYLNPKSSWSQGDGLHADQVR